MLNKNSDKHKKFSKILSASLSLSLAGLIALFSFPSTKASAGIYSGAGSYKNLPKYAYCEEGGWSDSGRSGRTWLVNPESTEKHRLNINHRTYAPFSNV